MSKKSNYCCDESIQQSTLGQRRRSNIPSLVCAFSASVTTGGTAYAFGIFANDLKRALHLSQMELGAVSAAFFVAGLISWLPGMVVDKLKMRFSMTLGGVAGAFFTTLYWLVCRNPRLLSSTLMTRHPIAILSMLALAISLSCGLIVGSIFKLTMLCGGSKGRGPAVGIAKGFVGLGSGLYATIFQAFRDYKESALDFLPVISCFFLVCAALPAWLLLPPREQAHPHFMVIETTPLHFRTMYVSLLVLCIFILTSALETIWNESSNMEDSPASRRQYGKVFLILLLWLGPIVSLLYLPRQDGAGEDESRSLIPHASTDTDDEDITQESNSNYGSSLSPTDVDEEQQSLESEAPPAVLTTFVRALSDEQEGGVSSPLSSPHQGQNEHNNCVAEISSDLTLPEMLQTPSAWLMVWVAAILVGSGTAKTNNMGEMVESLGFGDAVTPATLAIFSVAQAGARILTGVSSEAALQQFGIPRPVFLVVASCITLLAHVVLAVTATTSTESNLPAFVIGCTLSAVAFGMAWPLMVLIVGDVFGLEHHGANYMFYDGGTKALGTIFLSELLVGSVYEAHIEDHPDNETAITCYGPGCFQWTHISIAALSVTCILASVLLCKTTRSAYY